MSKKRLEEIKELVELINAHEIAKEDDEGREIFEYDFSNLSDEEIAEILFKGQDEDDDGSEFGDDLDDLTSIDDLIKDIEKFLTIESDEFGYPQAREYGRTNGGGTVLAPPTPIKKKSKKELEKPKIMTPSQMVKELDKTVIGHTEAKKQIAVAFFRFLSERKNKARLRAMGKEFTKSNLLLTGLSGSGKTFILQELCRILGLDCLLIDASTITSEGYVGASLIDEVGKIYDVCDGDLERISSSVIILDEIDKLRASGGNDGKPDVNGSGATKAFLKVLEGTEIKVGNGYSKKYFNTKDIMFVCTGTFNECGLHGTIEDIVRERIDKKGIKRAVGFFGADKEVKDVTHDRSEVRSHITAEDIIKYGFSVEIIARIGSIINLEILKREDYVKIAKLEKNGFGEYNTLFELYGKRLSVEEEVYEVLADAMIESETNARSLKPIVDKVLVPIVYHMMEDGRKKNYKITKEMVEEVVNEKKVDKIES